MPITEIHRPADLAAAAELLSRTDEHIVPLAVSPRMPVEPYAGADAVVDLSRLKLSYITEDDAGIHIGALTPLQDIAESELLRGVANGIVCEAAELAAHLGLRNIATLGGALLSKDGPPELRLVLRALKAQVLIRTAESGEYSVGLDSTWEQTWPTEILLEVKIAREMLLVAGALERVARTPRDAAIVAAVVAVESTNGIPMQAHVRVGPNPSTGVSVAVSPGKTLTLAHAIQTALQTIEAEARPVSDFRASEEYRRAMASVLAQRALEKAWQRARQVS